MATDGLGEKYTIEELELALQDYVRAKARFLRLADKFVKQKRRERDEGTARQAISDPE